MKLAKAYRLEPGGEDLDREPPDVDPELLGNDCTISWMCNLVDENTSKPSPLRGFADAYPRVR